MTSSIRIKLGPIEVEYEGSEEFLKEELPELLSAIAELHRASGLGASPSPPGEATEGSVPPPTAGGTAVTTLSGMTTGTIAARLKAKSGRGLITAAAAKLELVDGKSNYTRQQLLEEMQTASGYYKQSYRKSLTSYLHGAVKADLLREVSKDTYALASAESENLRGKLA